MLIPMGKALEEKARDYMLEHKMRVAVIRSEGRWYVCQLGRVNVPYGDTSDEITWTQVQPVELL